MLKYGGPSLSEALREQERLYMYEIKSTPEDRITIIEKLKWFANTNNVISLWEKIEKELVITNPETVITTHDDFQSREDICFQIGALLYDHIVNHHDDAIITNIVASAQMWSMHHDDPDLMLFRAYIRLINYIGDYADEPAYSYSSGDTTEWFFFWSTYSEFIHRTFDNSGSQHQNPLTWAKSLRIQLVNSNHTRENNIAVLAFPISDMYELEFFEGYPKFDHADLIEAYLYSTGETVEEFLELEPERFSQNMEVLSNEMPEELFTLFLNHYGSCLDTLGSRRLLSQTLKNVLS